jgi:GntR family transcriptional regulator, transcriptional repressor for pyruvate dehydrogenase complex
MLFEQSQYKYSGTSMNIKKINLSDLIVKRIKEHIETKNLKVGDRLPTEQEMATTFGVSRISIREATKPLNFLGIIRAAPRRGLTVGPVDIKKMTEILGFHFILDDFPKDSLVKTRTAIEIGSLQYAINAVVSDDILYTKLIAMCDKLDQTKDVPRFIEGDVEFHRTLVDASKVTPLVVFNDVVNAFFMKFRGELLSMSEATFFSASQVHRKIVTSLRNNDLIGAENALRKHLDAFDELSNKKT